MKLIVTSEKPITLLNCSALRRGQGMQYAPVTPGEHNLTRAPDPRDEGAFDWLVIEGTDIGAAEIYLRKEGMIQD